ncbi:hypothetical protein SLEP1_g1879 [Rubroshorea leprosula]|uniref:SCP domain-containing protein n=1 Tax=Rubroshorea leprosula TaxID=152421 RepID=A0AAV5HL54_9ROSI|nr:hypothetical protein SLEP1_g1879 [Rubroshorea leprosula]
MEIRPKIFPSLLTTLLFLSSFVSLSSSSPLIFRPLLIEDTSRTASIQQFLIPHNIARSELGLPLLKWSKKLADFASWWAQQRQGDCALIHSKGNYGQNLFWGSGKDWKLGDAVAVWAAEKSYYNYNGNSCTQNKDCLHYTQMVWRQSLKVGRAKVVCSSGDTLITCNYDPQGNVS